LGKGFDLLTTRVKDGEDERYEGEEEAKARWRRRRGTWREAMWLSLRFDVSGRADPRS